MSTDEKELLDDAMILLAKIKANDKLWRGEVGLSPTHREDITDLLRRNAQQRKNGSNGS